MPETPPAEPDSRIVCGGSLPGTRDEAAWSLRFADAAPVPIVVAVPHAGRSYPERLRAELRDPGASALRLEDRRVDEIAGRLAAECRVSVLTAHAPRAMIDLNRAPDDVDWTMVRATGDALPAPSGSPSRRVRSGLGLVPRRVPGVGELWRRPLDHSELNERIERIHVTYHAALQAEMRRLRDRWGAALLIDLHSMPPISAAAATGPPPQFVFGDRFGASCAGSIGAVVFNQLGGEGWRVAHNRPYAGGYVLDRHGAPRRAMHAFQLEICRSAYLDKNLDDIGPGADSVSDSLARLIRKLGAEISALGSLGNMALAAE